MSTIMGIDIETYSSAPLPKCGVYRYTDAPDFEVLLFSYAYDDGSVVTVDLACGEELPPDVIDALNDDQLGTDATNPSWIKSGRAIPCEYGLYPLGHIETNEVEVVEERSDNAQN